MVRHKHRAVVDSINGLVLVSIMLISVSAGERGPVKPISVDAVLPVMIDLKRNVSVSNELLSGSAEMTLRVLIPKGVTVFGSVIVRGVIKSGKGDGYVKR